MNKLHECFHHTKCSGWGDAVGACYEKKDGTLWVDNGEYGSQVNFCPYCGYKAKVPAISLIDYNNMINELKDLISVEDTPLGHIGSFAEPSRRSFYRITVRKVGLNIIFLSRILEPQLIQRIRRRK